ncbi:MAG: peptidyl-prolyl cis-trans isomerase [Pseudomonadales bacterium]|nr:peptidyl-prolyl cis-trans isomerase [Pseudomonadales bacterium]
MDAWLGDRPDEIIVDDGVRTRLTKLWQAQAGSPPTEAQLDALVENWIQEEVFYREALRLQLDREDTIIRRRLIQKLGFIAEDVAEPDEAALRTYYNENLADYTLPERYTFYQIFFADDAAAATEALSELRDDDAGWRELGAPGMLSHAYASRSEPEIAATFGKAFASHLASLEAGEWRGPVSSVFGQHLVKINRVHPPETAPFTSVQRNVLNDYLYRQRQQSRQQYYEELLDHYDVVRK